MNAEGKEKFSVLKDYGEWEERKHQGEGRNAEESRKTVKEAQSMSQIKKE